MNHEQGFVAFGSAVPGLSGHVVGQDELGQRNSVLPNGKSGERNERSASTRARNIPPVRVRVSMQPCTCVERADVRGLRLWGYGSVSIFCSVGFLRGATFLRLQWTSECNHM